MKSEIKKIWMRSFRIKMSKFKINLKLTRTNFNKSSDELSRIMDNDASTNKQSQESNILNSESMRVENSLDNSTIKDFLISSKDIDTQIHYDKESIQEDVLEDMNDFSLDKHDSSEKIQDDDFETLDAVQNKSSIQSHSNNEVSLVKTNQDINVLSKDEGINDSFSVEPLEGITLDSSNLHTDDIVGTIDMPQNAVINTSYTTQDAVINTSYITQDAVINISYIPQDVVSNISYTTQDVVSNTSYINNSNSNINLTIEHPNIKIEYNYDEDSLHKKIKNEINNDESIENINNSCINDKVACENNQESHICSYSPQNELKDGLKNIKSFVTEIDRTINTFKNEFLKEIDKCTEDYMNDLTLFENEKDTLLDQCKEQVEQAQMEYSECIIDFLNNLFKRVNIDTVNEVLGELSNKFVQYINQYSAESSRLLKENEEKGIQLKATHKEYEILKVKSNMLEENVDYLHKQNDALRVSNNQIRLKMGVISAMCNNLKKIVGDIEVFKKELNGLISIYYSEIENKVENAGNIVLDLKMKFNHLNNMISKLDPAGLKKNMLDSVGDFESLYGLEISSVKTFGEELASECNALKSRNLELEEKNEELKILIKEMKGEIELKESYTKELERSTEDLLKSTKFYEDQLINSDVIIKTLKDTKTKSGMEFAAEIEKLKKAFLRENGLLKLRIEELEEELSSKMSTNSP